MFLQFRRIETNPPITISFIIYFTENQAFYVLNKYKLLTLISIIMEKESYKLLPNTDNTCIEIIHSNVTDINIKVCNNHNNAFTPNPNEIRLCAETDGKALVFETIDLSVSNGLDVFDAIKWYTRQVLDRPDTLITHYDA